MPTPPSTLRRLTMQQMMASLGEKLPSKSLRKRVDESAMDANKLVRPRGRRARARGGCTGICAAACCRCVPLRDRGEQEWRRVALAAHSDRTAQQ